VNVPLKRLGGICALLLGLCYLVITGLYIGAGAVPEGVPDRLGYLAVHTGPWWAITGLSVLTDILFLAVIAAICSIPGTRTAALAGAGLLGLFAILDLAVTWPNYASLISMSADYAAAADADRAAIAGAATYPAAVLDSPVFAAYAILVPAIGILFLSTALPGVTRYAGFATGVLGAIAVVGPYAWKPLGAAAILASILTTVWVFLVGRHLLRPSTRGTEPVAAVSTA
jgi:hypothetical protein